MPALVPATLYSYVNVAFFDDPGRLLPRPCAAQGFHIYAHSTLVPSTPLNIIFEFDEPSDVGGFLAKIPEDFDMVGQSGSRAWLRVFEVYIESRPGRGPLAPSTQRRAFGLPGPGREALPRRLLVGRPDHRHPQPRLL